MAESKVMLPVCAECGLVVGDVDLHTQWHERIDEALSYVYYEQTHQMEMRERS